jgi:DNA gyrase inhibitor GyrI
MRLLAVRHLGDYGRLNESFGEDSHAWSELVAWARASGVAIDPVYLGIYYDDPTMTPEPQRRADVCVPLRGTAHVPVSDGVRCLEFAGGSYAIAEFVGPISHLLSGYRGVADEVRRSVKYDFRQDYPLAFLRTPNVDGRRGVHRIDVCFPVARKGR